MLQYLKNIPLLTLSLIMALAANAQNTTDTVSLVVSGQGATLEEARTNALRSAIEQAYGTFISTKTELLNDRLVKNEVVSVTNGNILGYETKSQISIPGGGYAITLRAMVSLKNLTSFVESKGGSVDIKGGVFAANMKLKLLNEKAELEAVLNICDVSWKILSNSVDFDLEVGNHPVLINKEEQTYSLPILIKAKTNQNKTAFYNYFTSSMKELSVDKNELESFQTSKIPLYKAKVIYTEIILRNEKSILAIKNLIVKSNVFYYSFKLISNIDTVQVGHNYPLKFNHESTNINQFQVCTRQDESYDYYNDTCNPIIGLTEGIGDLNSKILFLLNTIIITNIDYNCFNIFTNKFFTDLKWQSTAADLNLYYVFDFPVEIDYYRTSYVNININKTFKLSELELLEGYRIEKIDLSWI